MATLYRAYTSTHDAENAIERLLSAGVPAIRIELIMGRAVQDARDAPIGTFAGTTTADAQTVGSYGNIAHSGREAMGTLRRRPGQAAPRLVRRHRSRHRHDLPVGREANAHRVAPQAQEDPCRRRTGPGDRCGRCGRAARRTRPRAGPQRLRAGRHRGRDRRPRPRARLPADAPRCCVIGPPSRSHPRRSPRQRSGSSRSLTSPIEPFASQATHRRSSRPTARALVTVLRSPNHTSRRQGTPMQLHLAIIGSSSRRLWSPAACSPRPRADAAPRVAFAGATSFARHRRPPDGAAPAARLQQDVHQPVRQRPAGCASTSSSAATDRRCCSCTAGPSNWYQYRALMPALARDFTVIAVDQRGMGSRTSRSTATTPPRSPTTSSRSWTRSATSGSPWSASTPGW